jgi:hypothetical protein
VRVRTLPRDYYLGELRERRNKQVRVALNRP